jgi:four helix bundle protein
MESDERTPTAGAAGGDPGSSGALGRVTAYGLAVAAGELAWEDATAMKQEPLLAEIGPQLLRATGSIAANIAEGYARRSARDRIRYYEYALGSGAEAQSWYRTARRALSSRVYDERLACLTSIRRLLLAMIKNERSGSGWNAASR